MIREAWLIQDRTGRRFGCMDTAGTLRWHPNAMFAIHFTSKLAALRFVDRRIGEPVVVRKETVH